MLGKLTREDEADGGLDLSRRNGRLLGVSGEFCKGIRRTKDNLLKLIRTGCLSGDALEDVVDEAVQDSHRLVRDTGIGVDLLED